MRKNISQVLSGFFSGKSVSVGPCKTDGKLLVWSYEMPIAMKLGDGTYVVLHEKHSPSKTTTTHIRSVLGYLHERNRVFTQVELIHKRNGTWTYDA